MATYEHSPLMKYKDENGDLHINYPVTKAENVMGLYENPAMTGVPTAPTAEAGTNTEQVATTAFVKNAVDNVTVPTTDTITQGSTDALTSGGLYSWLNPSGASFGMDGQLLMVTGRQVLFTDSNAGGGMIETSRSDDYGARVSATNGVKIEGGNGTYDSSATNGFRKCTISAHTGGFNISCDGRNSTIGTHGINFAHSWSHDAVYAPILYPNTKATIDLGCPWATWNTIYLANSPSVTSDRNQKKDITYMAAEDADKIISKLKPCRYRFVDGTSGRIHNGLIAQDVEEALTELNIDTNDFAAFIKSQKAEIDEKGNPKPIEGEYNYSLRYEEFISLLISECQYLKSRINDLESRLPVTE